jgi:hypothetical protein
MQTRNLPSAALQLLIFWIPVISSFVHNVNLSHAFTSYYLKFSYSATALCVAAQNHQFILTNKNKAKVCR